MDDDWVVWALVSEYVVGLKSMLPVKKIKNKLMNIFSGNIPRYKLFPTLIIQNHLIKLLPEIFKNSIG